MATENWFQLRFAGAAQSFAELKLPDFSDWEIEQLKHAVDNEVLQWDGHSITLTKESYKNRPYKLFTLNREYFIQWAVYSLLIHEYKYPQEDCFFEYDNMDIVIKKDGAEYICIETKVKDYDANELLKGILKKIETNDFSSIMYMRDDPARKTECLYRLKPSYFWLISSKNRRAFKVIHNDNGFLLSEIDDIPKYLP
ncbi:MAG: hypothetical protein ACXVZU_02925 [Methanobacteriaceae archaeon]